jgi:hypothetical protein
MAHKQEVVSSNPDTVYWMDVSDAKAITLSRKWGKKGSQMGHTKKIFFKLSLHAYCYGFWTNLSLVRIWFDYLLTLNFLSTDLTFANIWNEWSKTHTKAANDVQVVKEFKLKI